MGAGRKHSEEMRQAIAQAAVVQGYSAQQIVEFAAAGELGGLAPFDIAGSTVHDIAAKARRQATTSRTGDDPTAKRSRRVAEQTIARVEALEQPSAKDLHALREAVRIVRDADRARQLPEPAPKTGRRSTGGSDLVAVMQAAHDAYVRAVAEGRVECSHVVNSRSVGTDRHCVRCLQPMPDAIAPTRPEA